MMGMRMGMPAEDILSSFLNDLPTCDRNYVCILPVQHSKD
jgi:hypothetical protein